MAVKAPPISTILVGIGSGIQMLTNYIFPRFYNDRYVVMAFGLVFAIVLVNVVVRFFQRRR